MMKKLKRALVEICMLCVLCVFALPTQVLAANASVNVTMGTTDNARAGDTVTARLIISNNPGLSTFAMKLAYDSNYLTYTKATWADSVTANNSNVQMISEVTENGGPVLNISSIFNSTYTNNETLVTLEFTVRQNYTTMPVTLTNREITNSSYNAVTVVPIVDATAGLTNNDTQNSQTSQSQSNSQDNSQNNSQNNNQNNSQNNSQADSQNNSQNNSQTGNQNDSQSNGQDNSQTTNSSQNNNSNTGSKDNNKNNSSDKKSDNKKLDKTPKTGVLDIRMVLGGMIVVFLIVAGICVKVLGRKKM